MNDQLSFNPETSELLTVLADPHCRSVLTHLQDTSAEVASVEDLADEINNQDYGGPNNTAIQLHHATLPRLAEVGVVEYDARSNTVRYRGHAELESLLEAIANR